MCSLINFQSLLPLSLLLFSIFCFNAKPYFFIKNWSYLELSTYYFFLSQVEMCTIHRFSIFFFNAVPLFNFVPQVLYYTSNPIWAHAYFEYYRILTSLTLKYPYNLCIIFEYSFCYHILSLVNHQNIYFTFQNHNYFRCSSINVKILAEIETDETFKEIIIN